MSKTLKTLLIHKYQALGNDYFVWDPVENEGIELNEALIRKLCDRHFGIGSDGILMGPVEGGVVDLQIFNPDGSEAEKSGNGLRIFAQYLWDSGRCETGKEMQLQTLGGKVTLCVQKPSEAIAVQMGRASFMSKDIGMEGDNREAIEEKITIEGESYTFSAASVGNPHCVIFLKEPPTRSLAEKVGPRIEKHPLFLNRTNVQLAYVQDKATLCLEIWERGAGYTLASGSSASASAALANRLGYCGNDITVEMPGGALQVNMGKNFEITQTGPAKKIATMRLEMRPF